MRNVLTGSTRRLSRVSTILSRVWMCALLAVGACGPLETPPEEELWATSSQALESHGGLSAADLSLHGLSLNGLSLNGLSLNGLSLNGLSLNGLSLNGLAAEAFAQWFQEDAELHAQVMKYVVRCAVPANQTRTHTAADGRSWTWAGGLGLAPTWSDGASATLTEQRLVSACLAAHANKFGIQVAMSVLGRDARGAALATASDEAWRFPLREGCFFGNLFNGEGIYAGNDNRGLNHRNSTPRACALSIKKSGPPVCEPLVRVDSDCSAICTLDVTGRFYASCTSNGITYPALTTRLRTEDLYTCGDGVCQVSESCGTGTEYDNCAADCGACK
ncbi:hypothetical protein [Archangium primigenium]|uniref:hypothetical protein n=1 Tax=[Archangium] primigenium TaxID=2792470 RepID=UPI00195B8730|nr:hypothetical protein [Archangium primigenium]MBM7117303.1 hypothetical protein [Archangium primigenium]